jgi:Cu-processing system permease protein
VSALTLLNPAELARLFAVIKLGGGSMLGADYTDWVSWIRGGSGTLLFVCICLAWIAVCLGLAVWLWERGRRRG